MSHYKNIITKPKDGERQCNLSKEEDDEWRHASVHHCTEHGHRQGVHQTKTLDIHVTLKKNI